MAGNAGYAGYQGYDPAEEARVKRLRETANMLDQSASQQRPIRHWTQGVAQLAEAWLAKDAGREADAAETAYSDNRKKAADMLLNAVAPGDASQAAYQQHQPSMLENATMLAGGGPPVREGFDGFTPEQQASGDKNARLRALTQYLGDPMAAIQADSAMNPAPDYQALQGQNGAVSLFDKRTGNITPKIAATPPPPDPAKYTFQDMIGPEGVGTYAVNPADPTDLRKVGKPIPKEGSGQQPPSGYRYTADGRGLEPIPGGPADKAPGAGMDPDTIKLEREYAKDWKGVQSNFQDIDSQFNRMQSMANRGDAAGDLALVVSFTKMLDPGSVAREGEVALTQKAASLVDQAGNWINQLQNGQTLLPAKVRQQLLEAGREMHGVYKNAYQKLGKNYFETAKSYQYDPARVMMGYDADGIARDEAIRSASGNPWPTIRADVAQQQPAAQAQPQAGAYAPGAIDVDEDTGEKYRFKGGDPTNPNSWELVR